MAANPNENSPTSIGATIDTMFELRERKRELNAELKDIDEQYKGLEQQLIDSLDKDDLQQTRSGKATATISEVTVPSVTDWDAFYDYVRENDALHLLERRVAAAPWRELVESDEPVPGTEPFTKRSINLRRLK